jgi:translocation and assembly module TamB
LKRRTRHILWITPLVLVAVAWLGFTWLMNSTAGSNFIVKQALNVLEGRLSIGEVKGGLANGLQLKNLRYEDNGLIIRAARVDLVVDVGLMPQSANVRSLTVNEMILQLPPDSEGGQEVPLTERLQSLALPVPVTFKGSEVHTLTILDHDGEKMLELDRLRLAGTWGESLRGVRLEIEGESFAIQLNGSLGLAQGAGLELEFATQAYGSQLKGSVSGALDDYVIETHGNIELPELGVGQLVFTGLGGLQGMQAERLTFINEQIDVLAVGAVDWSGPLSVSTEVDLNHLFPRDWLAIWPAVHPLEGRASISWQGETIEIENLFAGARDTEFKLTGSGKYDPINDVIDAQLDWQGLAWPLGASEVLWFSDSGQGSLRGAPDNWQFQGRLQLDAPDYPGGNFVLDGVGGMASAVLDIEHGEAIGGTLAGQARMDWSEDFRWQANLQVEDVDLGVFLADWPAQLSAELGIEHDTGTGRLALDIQGLQGEFEGHSIAGSGGLVFGAPGVYIEQVQLRSDTSVVNLHGGLDDVDGIEFKLDVRHPGWISERLGGTISGSGRYVPQADNPLPELQLKGSDLAWGSLKVDSLIVSENTGHGRNRFDLQADATGVWYDELSLEEVKLNLNGDDDRQDMVISARDGAEEMSLELSGAVNDWSNPLGNGWVGELSTLSAIFGGEEFATLRQPAALGFSTDDFELSRACLETVEFGALCVRSSNDADAVFDIMLELESLNLNLIHLFMEHDLDYSQTLNGEINWRKLPGQNPTGRAAIDISAGQFGDVTDNDMPVHTAQGFIGFEMTQGNLTAGKLNLPIPDVGAINIDFDVSGVALDGSGQISGNAKIDIRDMAIFEAVITDLDSIQGSLRSNLKISGVTADPILEGSILIAGAGFEMPYLGLQAHDIELQGKVAPNDLTQIRGTLGVGEGTGTLEVNADFSDWLNPLLSVDLSGDRLRVTNLPDLEIDLDTEVSLSWKEDVWSIGGYIEVPHAYVQPITSIQNRVSESPDLHLVGGEMPPAPASATEGELALVGELELRLGDDVRLDAEVADLRFTGGLKLGWDNTLIPVANGTIEVLGEVTAWGPRLHMVKSFIRFPSVLISQPVLDIRAERDVFGNTVVRSAGVRMSGTTRRPEVEAYTIPLTTRDRAWAVLITGSDVNFSQGVSALDVGTYIAPRVFLSYGVSLFNADSVVGVRYDLKKGWGVKATSSQRESGIDLSYTIEH